MYNGLNYLFSTKMKECYSFCHLQSKRIKQEKPVKREQPESDDEDDQPLSAR